MIVVVMMVSMLRDVAQDRPSRTAVSPKKCGVILVPYPTVPALAFIAASPSLPSLTDDGEEDVLEGRLLLDVFHLGGREALREPARVPFTMIRPCGGSRSSRRVVRPRPDAHVVSSTVVPCSTVA